MTQSELDKYRTEVCEHKCRNYIPENGGSCAVWAHLPGEMVRANENSQPKPYDAMLAFGCKRCPDLEVC